MLSAEGVRVPSESVMLHLEGGIMPSEGGIQPSDVDMMLLEGGILHFNPRRHRPFRILPRHKGGGGLVRPPLPFRP